MQRRGYNGQVIPRCPICPHTQNEVGLRSKAEPKTQTMARKGKRRRKYENSSVRIKKTCTPHVSTTENDVKQLKVNLGFVPSNLLMVKKRSNDTSATPLACIMYPLSTTALNGKLEPFPTICWLTSSELRSRVSALEKSGWIKIFQNMLAANPRSHGKQMRAAHKSYAVARTSLLSDSDKHIVASNGWTGALSESRGVAGILKTIVGKKFEASEKYDSSNSVASEENIELTTWDLSVKCLHAHLAHYLCFPEHGNIIGEWTWHALCEHYDTSRFCTIVPLLNSIYQLWKDADPQDLIIKEQADMLNQCIQAVCHTNSDHYKLIREWEDIHSVTTTPPLGVKNILYKRTFPVKSLNLMKSLELLLEKSWNDLPWKVPKKLSGDYSSKMGSKIKALKSVMLVGNPEFGALIENPDLYVGLMYMEENMHYPPHAHEAFETYTMVSGNGSEIRREECKENGTTMVTASPTPYIHTNSNQTHEIQTTDKPLVCLYAWTSTRVGCSTKVTLPGKFWFC